ncbi:Serine/threonine-protein kinase cds1 [Taphrina deformans PYCC 5710]|uniref:Serine/threonine-protein kinase cds1 n=1 Tax=Taphrina deformans (strain PYCC 5710 / ATCC 11124 / CBS 356.35 / IMI 108563 / JCM 9778 / NBRC 8474) TaxID=1097556 RepID=R4X6W5_TAPDE|nr:Serine/threonine-protein kinase cds1 [Taphrina deformans PYCC 5710]|eukprot:CCG80711.1 Serine/threonine-protein kinase cds1 [Taphrina deformans PYCC 5710]
MASQTQQTQQTQEGHEYSMYDQSFDLSSTFARFVSTSNTDRFESVILPRKENGHVYTFGRHKSCDFILTGNRFSNIHFKVWEQETDSSDYGNYTSVVLVEDTSTNGTFLNQARIGKGQRTVLANGDELAAGVGIAKDEVRYLIQLPQQSRPKVVSNMSAEASACMQKYEIRQILGAGAFATVRAAIEKSSGTKYAVKILNQRKLAITNASSKATELFKREIEILQSTRHPNIVQYVDMWADDTEIYLVLEYLPGGDLMDYIMRRGKLDEYSTGKIIMQILDALVYCHKIGIAHRDIKPENILLTRDDPPVAKLTDFGLAKMVEPGSFLKTFCGTLTYVAPEVISMHGRIAGAYSTAVDMWSMGCVTFIMLAGSMPFIAEGQEAMMQVIQDGNYDDEVLDEIELSGAGLDFIESLLRVNPASRMTGEQALHHPWLSNLEYEHCNGGGRWDAGDEDNVEDQMDHDSQMSKDSREVRQLRVQGDSSAAAFAYDDLSSVVAEPSQHPHCANAYGLKDESSVDWSQVENGRGQVYGPMEKQAYLARLNSAVPNNSSWTGASHFSEDSSVNFLGSSKYVSAASQVEINDSNATITPQRLKRVQDINRQQAILYNNEKAKENTNPGRLYSSEPAFRHS